MRSGTLTRTSPSSRTTRFSFWISTLRSRWRSVPIPAMVTDPKTKPSAGPSGDVDDLSADEHRCVEHRGQRCHRFLGVKQRRAHIDRATDCSGDDRSVDIVSVEQ